MYISTRITVYSIQLQRGVYRQDCAVINCDAFVLGPIDRPLIRKRKKRVAKEQRFEVVDEPVPKRWDGVIWKDSSTLGKSADRKQQVPPAENTSRV